MASRRLELFADGGSNVFLQLVHQVAGVTEVASIAKAFHQLRGIRQLEIDARRFLAQFFLGPAEKLAAVFFFLVEHLLQVFIIEVKNFLQQIHRTLQRFKFRMQYFKSSSEVDVEIEVREVGFFEVFDDLGHVVETILLLLAQRIKMIQTVVRHRANKVRLGIIDLLLINTQPAHKSLLYDIFRILLTAYQVVGDRMQHRLIQGYGLCVAHGVNPLQRYANSYKQLTTLHRVERPLTELTLVSVEVNFFGVYADGSARILHPQTPLN